MSKKIKSLFTYLTSFISKGESSPKNEQKPQPVPQKNVFGGDNPLPVLRYVDNLNIIRSFYKKESINHGHIDYDEMSKKLNDMSPEQVQLLAQALYEIASNHLSYINVEIEEESVDEES
jgi:hypothetical protein